MTMRDWRDDLLPEHGCIVRKIEAQQQPASYRDVDDLVAILGAVQRELNDMRERISNLAPYAVCGCIDDGGDVCPACYEHML